jgi:TolA-binding protein
MKMALGGLVLLLFAAGVIWIVVAVRRHSGRKQAEAEREAAFLAELASAAARRAKPAALPAAAAPATAASAPAGPATAPVAQATAPAARATAPHTASEAIKGALARGNSGEAARLFVTHVEQRTRLTLVATEWEPLGRALLVQESYMEAAWALHAGAVVAGDALTAQKRLIEIAARASAAGHSQIALKLYNTLLKKYPGSQYAGLARASVKLEETKLTKG